MSDLNCFLAGMARLLCPLLLLILWHKKTGARVFPALAALIICFPVFIMAGMIRAGFSRDVPISFYIQQGILYGIFEEGAKFLAMRFLLTSYDTRKDAVTYGIGHGAFEEFGAGMACLGLIGSDKAAPEIFWVNLWSAVEGAAFVIALTVLICYGIRKGKSLIIMPVVILLHAISNAVMGIFYFNNLIVLSAGLLLTAGSGYAAYRCWKALWTPFENES